MRASSSILFPFMLAVALSFACAGCPCVRGVVNANEGLRWWLFSTFGAAKICPEMGKRGMPLKLAPVATSVSVGRFFPRRCSVRVDDATRTMTLDAAGDGYAFVPLVGRVGFTASLGVEYRPDFRLEPDATYVWGRFSRVTEAPDVRLLGAENVAVSLATKTAFGDLASLLARGVVASQIAEGFTVVHRDDGDDFALGILTPPVKPPRPLLPGNDHVMLATDIDEVHAAERDYLGPFALERDGVALFLRLHVESAPLEFTVVDKTTGDMWMQSYERGFPVGPPPGASLAYGVAPIGDTSRAVALAPGLYYVVVENRAPPLLAPLGVPTPFEAVGHVTYGVEVGDRP